MEGKRRWLSIPKYLELEIEGIKGGATLSGLLSN